MLPCFGDLGMGHPSRMLQPRARVLILATCSRVKGPVAQGTQRFSWLSSQLPRGQTFQLQKILRKFFHNFFFECFGGLPWRLTPVTKNACLAKTGSVFKHFQFSLKFFMTIHFLSQLKLIQTLRVTLYKLHCCTCSPPNLQEKRYGFLFYHLIS